ncbi:TetR/AcrR family transcriptional regulator [Flavobacterium agricola]|uniref:TetR/AcrR family transcriptional regulator n=1 Tax=Flavobacterium agricola TaxID=2870839 RepID=A0ABY6LWL8_9FLAO|nr:TetR/AcrR family transcriptional regulator [Flavobacterium agricola]UYW00725.1 TetR/AcrR family transcriptional regulator [Flavobacterium agricola]
MSKKQEILNASLILFTEQGARATSTKSIAKQAGVSEALIFKYFGTKDNLLEELIKKDYLEAIDFTRNKLARNAPKDFLIRFIDLPIELVDDKFDFWRMIYKILPLNPIAQQYHTNFMKPSHDKLRRCFESLGYPKAEYEAEILLLFTDTVWKNYVSGNLTKESYQEIATLLKKKYALI